MSIARVPSDRWRHFADCAIHRRFHGWAGGLRYHGGLIRLGKLAAVLVDQGTPRLTHYGTTPSAMFAAQDYITLKQWLIASFANLAAIGIWWA